MSGKTINYLYLTVTIFWMGCIYYFSSLPGPDVPRVVFGQDKLLHAAVFGILGFLMAGALTTARNGYRTWQFWFVVFAAALYGVLDELHQKFVPGRSADIYDVIADSAGGLLGACIMVLAVNILRERSTRRGSQA